MAGLVPAIHVLLCRRAKKKGVDARPKAGHDRGSPVFTGARVRILCRHVAGSAQGPRDDRSTRIARTCRDVAALDRGRQTAGLDLARYAFRTSPRRGAADPRMGGGRGYARPPGTVARDRFRVRRSHLFQYRPRAGAVGGGRAACRDDDDRDFRPPSADGVSGRGRRGGFWPRDLPPPPASAR